jgi:DNA-binding XRE family transcriptional regulator
MELPLHRSKTDLVNLPRNSVPNIASVLREEIVRISRRGTRAQIEATKKAAAQHRHDIAELKRQVALLQRQIKFIAKRVSSSPGTAASEAAGTKLRFVAKGLRSHRNRLGLSAGDFGRLVGASANSVYAWETGKSVPRRAQLARIAAIRVLGKREALARLKAAGARPRGG